MERDGSLKLVNEEHFCWIWVVKSGGFAGLIFSLKNSKKILLPTGGGKFFWLKESGLDGWCDAKGNAFRSFETGLLR